MAVMGKLVVASGFIQPSPASATQDSDPCISRFIEQSQGSTLDLHEIVDISEEGIALLPFASRNLRP